MDYAAYRRELDDLPVSSREEEQRLSEQRLQSEEEIRRLLIETPAVAWDICELARGVLGGELEAGRVLGGEDLKEAAAEWDSFFAEEDDPVAASDRLLGLPMLFRHFEPWIERLFQEAARVREEGFDELASARHGDPLRFERQVLGLDEAVAKRIDALESLFNGARVYVGLFVERVYDPDGDLASVVEAGEWGLRKACAKYDYRRGYRLTTYASWWILATLEGATGLDVAKFAAFKAEFEENGGFPGHVT